MPLHRRCDPFRHRSLQGHQRQPRLRRRATNCFLRPRPVYAISIRPEDTLARIEGDEFVVLCEGTLRSGRGEEHRRPHLRGDDASHSIGTAGELVISVSAGVALASSPSVEAGALLGDADAAMYRAKAAGRARSALFAESDAPDRRRPARHRDLVAAIDRQRRPARALPTHRQPRRRADPRPRGARPVGASGARSARSRRVHHDRRGDRD